MNDHHPNPPGGQPTSGGFPSVITLNVNVTLGGGFTVEFKTTADEAAVARLVAANARLKTSAEALKTAEDLSNLPSDPKP